MSAHCSTRHAPAKAFHQAHDTPTVLPPLQVRPDLSAHLAPGRERSHEASARGGCKRSAGLEDGQAGQTRPPEGGVATPAGPVASPITIARSGSSDSAMPAQLINPKKLSTLLATLLMPLGIHGVELAAMFYVRAPIPFLQLGHLGKTFDLQKQGSMRLKTEQVDNRFRRLCVTCVTDAHRGARVHAGWVLPRGPFSVPGTDFKTLPPLPQCHRYAVRDTEPRLNPRADTCAPIARWPAGGSDSASKKLPMVPAG